MREKVTRIYGGTTKSVRETFKLTQEGLANLFMIPLSTVRNWDARETMPDYIYNMMMDALTLYRCTISERCQRYKKTTLRESKDGFIEFLSGRFTDEQITALSKMIDDIYLNW